MSYKDTRQELQKGAILLKSIQTNFLNTLWRFLQRRTATMAIVSSPSHLPPDKRWGQVSQRKVNLGSEQWLGWAGTKIVLAFKLVLLIQAIFKTEKLFTNIFGISPTSWTKNQYTFHLYHK